MRLYEFARACDEGSAPACAELSADGFAPDDLPYWMERAYLDADTTVGPDEAEYLHVTVLTFQDNGAALAAEREE